MRNLIATILIFNIALADNASTNALLNLVPIILVVLVGYFLIIRPNQKRIKEHNDLMASLKEGDIVCTKGGIIGKIAALDSECIKLQISQEVTFTMLRESVLYRKENIKLDF